MKLEVVTNSEGVVLKKSLIRVENQKTNYLQVVQLIWNCLQLDLKQAIQNMKFLGKPFSLIKFLRKTYLVDEDKKKKALRKEFNAFQRLQGESFKQMITHISLIILMCENSGIKITNEEKVTTLLYRIGSQMWAQTILTIQQIAEGKNWNFKWMKKDLIEKEKVMKEIMNKRHSANIAHQAFASPASIWRWKLIFWKVFGRRVKIFGEWTKYKLKESIVFKPTPNLE